MRAGFWRGAAMCERGSVPGPEEKEAEAEAGSETTEANIHFIGGGGAAAGGGGGGREGGESENGRMGKLIRK